MPLPKAERREIKKATKVKAWFYGAPMSGKSVFADQFPMPLEVNTDGNTSQLTAPVAIIKALIDKKGEVKRDEWEVFQGVVTDLLKPNNPFGTVIVSLVEDLYQYCRNHYYIELKISHESEGDYSQAWDISRNAFLKEMSRLIKGDYNVILFSHDKEETYTTRFKKEKTKHVPNLAEKLSTKIAGMVDIVGRIYKEEREFGDHEVECHLLQVPATSDVFGGTRLVDFNIEEMELDPVQFVELLGLDIEIASVQDIKVHGIKPIIGSPTKLRGGKSTKKKRKPRGEKVVEAEVEETEVETITEVVEETPDQRRERRKAERKAAKNLESTDAEEAEVVGDKPEKGERKSRSSKSGNEEGFTDRESLEGSAPVEETPKEKRIRLRKEKADNVKEPDNVEEPEVIEETPKEKRIRLRKEKASNVDSGETTNKNKEGITPRQNKQVNEIFDKIDKENKTEEIKEGGRLTAKERRDKRRKREGK